MHGIHLNLVEVAHTRINIRMQNYYGYHATLNSANNWLSLNILHKVIYKKFYNTFGI